MNTYIIHFTLKHCFVPFAEQVRSDEYNFKLFEEVIKDRIAAAAVTLHGKPAEFDKIFFVQQVDPIVV